MGADQVPAEFVKELVAIPEGLTGLTRLFQTVLSTGIPPSSWSQSVIKLLPKTSSSTCPKQLRPIALSSHISKVFVKVLLSRMGMCSCRRDATNALPLE